MPKTSHKADFIRSQPRDLSVKDLQRAAKKAGVGAVSKNYIWKVRSTAKVVRVARVTQTKRAPYDKPAIEQTLTAEQIGVVRGIPASPTELQFRRLIVVIGTERAHELLKSYEGFTATIEA